MKDFFGNPIFKGSWVAWWSGDAYALLYGKVLGEQVVNGGNFPLLVINPAYEEGYATPEIDENGDTKSYFRSPNQVMLILGPSTE